jgi:hypothetical protein
MDISLSLFCVCVCVLGDITFFLFAQCDKIMYIVKSLVAAVWDIKVVVAIND